MQTRPVTDTDTYFTNNSKESKIMQIQSSQTTPKKKLSEALASVKQKPITDNQYFQARINGLSQKKAEKLTHTEMHDNSHLFFTDDGLASELQITYLANTLDYEIDVRPSFHDAKNLIIKYILENETDERLERIITERNKNYAAKKQTAFDPSSLDDEQPLF